MKKSNGAIGLVRQKLLQFTLTSEELKAVDNFRFEHRMPSRAAAVRELLRRGIAAGGVQGNAGIKFDDHGV